MMRETDTEEGIDALRQPSEDKEPSQPSQKKTDSDVLSVQEQEEDHGGFFQRQRCSYTACAASLLITANLFTFGLMITLGSILGFMEDDASEYERVCFSDSSGFKQCGWERKEPKSMLPLLILLITGQTVVSIITLYFVCKPSREGRRLLRAGMAVFCCCCQDRKDYEEALVPYSSLLENCWVGFRSCVCGISLASLKLCLLPTTLALAFLFWNGVFSEGSNWARSQPTLMISLSIVAGMLWFLVWKFLFSEGNFFVSALGKDAIDITSASNEEEKEDAEAAATSYSTQEVIEVASSPCSMNMLYTA